MYYVINKGGIECFIKITKARPKILELHQP